MISQHLPAMSSQPLTGRGFSFSHSGVVSISPRASVVGSSIVCGGVDAPIWG